MNGRTTQLDRLVVVEPTEAVVRATTVSRLTAITPTGAVIRTTMLCRLVVIQQTTTTNALTTQVARLVAIEPEKPVLGERAYGYIIA